MKKVISFVLSICLTTGLFSGCSFNRISAEEDIINMQMGSYLYTSSTRADTKNERNMLKEREKAVSTMIDYIGKAAKHAFGLNDSFSNYEDNLRKYMGKINEASSADSSMLFDILERITAYRVILESHEEEINEYKKMKPDSPAVQSILNIYMIDAVCKLIDTQNEYAAWLINNTASVAVILEKENQRQSERLISTASSTYVKQINGNLIDALENYEAGAFLNSVILSADYYVSSTYLENAEKKIMELKSGKSKTSATPDEIAELEAMYDEAANSIKKPSVLKQIPEVKSPFTLIRKVSAEKEFPAGFLLVASMLEFYTKLNIYEMSLEAVPPDNEKIIENQLNEKTKEIKQSPQKAETNITSIPNPAAKKSKDATLFATTVNYLTEKAENTVAYVKDTVKDTVKETALDLGFDVSIIVKYAQSYIRKTYGDTDSRYAAIIDKLAGHLAGNKNVKDAGQKDYVLNLINVELENMLGGNKGYFVNYILYSNADDLVDTFNIWKNNLAGGDKHVYTQANLIDLLGIMGIEIEEDIAQQALANTPPPTKTPSPSATEIPASSSPNPDETNEPIDSTQTEDNFGIVHIKATWQTMREIDPTSSNESVLAIIYGWGDILDYENYEKTEIKSKDGNIRKIYYEDEKGHKAGWEISYGDTYNLFTYRFPNDNDREIVITRSKTAESDYIYNIETEDETIDRKTAVRFNYSATPSDDERIIYIIQKEGSQRDGLNTTSLNSNRTYSLFNMGVLTERYSFKAKIMIRESSFSYDGDNVTEIIKTYYDNGDPKHEYTEVNGTKHGIFTSYDKDTGETSTWEYKDGFVVKP